MVHINFVIFLREKQILFSREITAHTRELDSTRPVTFVGNQSPLDDKAVSDTS